MATGTEDVYSYSVKKITKLCVRLSFVIAFVPRLVDPFIHLFSGGNVENEFEEIVKASEVMKIRIFVFMFVVHVCFQSNNA